jgi:ZIP family zinc transporter
MESVLHWNPILLALLATSFTWAVTALGAACVFIGHDLSRKWLDGLLGFAGGVMIAASFWSLLSPAIAMAEGGPVPAWLPAAVGFLLGGLCLRAADKLLPHLHVGYPMAEAEGVKTTWRRTTLLVLAITLHNLPEGLAVGVAFGAAAAGLPAATLTGALALAVGIGIQNFPEGLAVALPLRRAGTSRLKSFWYGQLSGMVEPVAGVLGALAVVSARALLPYALAFAAGAMIFVVIEEVIPEAQREGNADLATLAAMLGFTVMMVLDVALG